MVGVLGDAGLTLREHCQLSVRLLDYFGEADPHARQYSVIVQSLLKVTTAYVEKRELRLRLQRKQASSELFGLLPAEIPYGSRTHHAGQAQATADMHLSQPPRQDNISASAPLDWTIYDADFFALPWPNENDQGLQDFLQPGTHNLDGASVADIPLFPIFDQQADRGYLR